MGELMLAVGRIISRAPLQCSTVFEPRFVHETYADACLTKKKNADRRNMHVRCHAHCSCIHLAWQTNTFHLKTILALPCMKLCDCYFEAAVYYMEAESPHAT